MSVRDSVRVDSKEELLSLAQDPSALQIKKLYCLGHFYSDGLPFELSRFSNLEELSVAVNHLTEIPDYFADFKKLKTLDLSANYLSDLEKIFDILGSITTLETLELANNGIKVVPENLSKLTNLRNLDLGLNGIVNLPEGIKSLTKLSSLYLGVNPIDFYSINRTICDMPNLNRLDLGDCKLKEWPPNLHCLSNVTELNLSRNNFTEIPKEIAVLTCLEALYITDTKIQYIDSAIADLKKLWLFILARSTKLKKEEVDVLRSLMPNCTFIGYPE
ncbi:MAG: leucine-rich repeat domain-containing protein [Ignavibacteriaceae bacterium]|nr:leucine-rich repeat domain-containing protein [Ignavibacteriaceae bacterium]